MIFHYIARELQVVKRNGLQIHDPEKILPRIDAYLICPKQVDFFFSKKFSKSIDHFFTVKL